ncbi:MAG: methylmalonyl-CoA epimerase [Deltaproteobacteria bacterium]|nr:methylmalonyl-CoA epimerase [Deltaproteobacteria bacterium]
MIKKIDHIAVAVKDVEKAAEFYEKVLGLELGGIEEVEGMDVKVGFIPIGDTRIELVQPLDPKSGVAKFIEKRGEGIHHICYEVDNVKEALETYKERGAILIDETPRKGAHNSLVGFIHPKSTGGVLTELTEHLEES